MALGEDWVIAVFSRRQVRAFDEGSFVLLGLLSAVHHLRYQRV